MQSCGIMIVMKKSHSRKELQITSVPIYSATVCNHISKWKLYVGQVHSYFTRHFTADCTPIMSRVYNSLYAVELLLMLTLWKFPDASRWYVCSSISLFLELWRRVFACVNAYFAWTHSKRDQSGTLDAICMISCYCLTGQSVSLKLQL